MKPQNLLIYSTIIILHLVFLLLAYWLYFPYQIYRFNTPHETDKRSYIGGQLVRYHVTGMELGDCEHATVIREIINGVVITALEENTNGIDTGKVDFWSKGVELPRYLDGTYKIRITRRCQVNPIRTITNVTETRPFTVTKGD